LAQTLKTNFKNNLDYGLVGQQWKNGFAEVDNWLTKKYSGRNHPEDSWNK